MQLDKAKARIVSKISGLNDLKNSLFQLQSVWDNLALLAQLSGTGTDMTQTRTAFTQVTQNVLDSLANEMLNKTIKSLSSKAFVIINILIRNLFERTADIGFLSTDDDVRDFLVKQQNSQSNARDVDLLKVRFNEYIKKYTVYENIILLDTNGNVLIQLDESNSVTHSADPIISESLNSNASYVEIYRHTDLMPKQKNSLIYAYRVISADNRAIGVLCLCFRFESEMDVIFKNLLTSSDWTVGVMLDKNQEVIASSDQHQIPLGARLEVTSSGADWQLTRFAGREYIAVTRNAQSYQGYTGPGWMGHAMIPLEHAFDNDNQDEIDGVDSKIMAKVMRSPLIFSQDLLDIPKNAAIIQNKLNQSVWNGNIWQINASESSHVENDQGKFSKSLLWEISNTGFKTQNIIEKIVTQLYQTVVSTLLEHSKFSAFLAADIMDRNLYERANDCRWWALSIPFRTILAKSDKNKDDLLQLEKILMHINGLYTVYANLVIFDSAGKLLAVSNQDYKDCVGMTIQHDWISKIRTLKDSQKYLVSKFEPSPLYQHKSTYIYGAAVRALDNNNIVGGVGIVFDSEPQFSAILQDALPLDDKDEPVKDSFSLFVNEDLLVIASTNPNITVGSTFDMHPNLCNLNSGESKFDIAEYQHQYFAIGAFASSGYREFKGPNDDYKNHITAMIFTPLGSATEIDSLIKTDAILHNNAFKISNPSISNVMTKDYATFYVDKDWFGIPVSEVAEALEPTNIRSVPGSNDIYEGLINYKNNVIPVFNMHKALNKSNLIINKHQQIIILKGNSHHPQFAILISALGEIPSIDPAKIEPNTNVFSAKDNSISTGMIAIATASSKSNILSILSAENLWNILNLKKVYQAA